MNTPLWFTRYFTSEDYLCISLLSLPIFHSKNLRIISTGQGARFRYCGRTGFNLWGKSHHGCLSAQETADLFRALVDRDALTAADSIFSATYGYRWVVRLRHRGTSNRFVFSNTAILSPPGDLEALLRSTLARFNPAAGSTPQARLNHI